MGFLGMNMSSPDGKPRSAKMEKLMGIEKLMERRTLNASLMAKYAKEIQEASENIQHFSVVVGRIDSGYGIGDQNGVKVSTQELNNIYKEGRLTISKEDYLELAWAQIKRDQETIKRCTTLIATMNSNIDIIHEGDY